MLDPGQSGRCSSDWCTVIARPDLPLLPVQIAENHLDLERAGVGAGGMGQLVDRLIDLDFGQKAEAEHVVRSFAEPAAVDPAAVPELVALPGLADGEPDRSATRTTISV